MADTSPRKSRKSTIGRATIIQFSSSAARPVSSLRVVENTRLGTALACLRSGCGELHSSFDLVTIGFPSRAAARRPGSSLTIQW